MTISTRIPCRGRGSLLAGLFLILGSHPVAAQDCTLPEKGTVFIGDTLRLELKCPASPGRQVSWEFGDGTPATDYLPSLFGTHLYTVPALYVVFARVKDEPVPIITSITVVHRPTAAAPTRSSTILFDPARKRVWAVNPDNNSVSAVDAVSKTLLFEVPAGKNPRTLALGPDGNIWVAAQDDGAVVILNGQTGSPVSTIGLPFASRPFGITFDRPGKYGYVTLESSGRLVRLDPASRQTNGSLSLGPTPRGLAITHDGARVLVTRHISRMTKAGAPDFGEVWEVDGSSFTLKRTFKLDVDTSTDTKDNSRGVPNGLASITITPDGRTAFVPCTKANTQKGLALDGAQPTFETSVRSILARINLVDNQEDMATRKDVDNRGMPSSIIFDRMGRFGYLNLHGNSRTGIYQASTMNELSTLPQPDRTPALLMKGEFKEVAPIGSVFGDNDSLLFVHYFLSREIGVYDATKAGSAEGMPSLALVKTVKKEALSLQVLVGKQIFHGSDDIRMGKDGYINCAVCHIDGSTDGRVWDFTDRGEGLRRTTSLLGRAGMDHGPVHWSANFDEIQDFEHDMRGPFGGEGFLDNAVFNQGTHNKTLGDKKAGLSPELDALAAYVASLAAVRASPFRNADGTMTAGAQAGKLIFYREDVGCVKCHVPPRFTDSRLPAPGDPITPGPVSVFAGAKSYYTAEGFLLHDVGTLKPTSGKRLNDTLKGLDTPTLKGAWETGPYLHDGSAATLLEVFTTANAGDNHGKTSQLTVKEKADLAEYLMQLDENPDGMIAGVRPNRTPLTGPSWRALGGGVVLFRVTGSLPPRITLHDNRGRLAAECGRDGGWHAVPGGWALRWTAQDLSGKPLPNGIYWARVSSGRAAASLRLVLGPGL